MPSPSGGVPAAGDLRPGQVLHLPRFELVPADSICKAQEQHTETYDHPVVITEVLGNHVKFMVATSLGDRTITERNWDESYMAAHLFIQHPRNDQGQYDNPVAGTILEMEKGCKPFAKPSYLRIDRELTIEANNLQFEESFRGHCRQIYLSEESMQRLRLYPKPAPLFSNSRSRGHRRANSSPVPGPKPWDGNTAFTAHLQELKSSWRNATPV